MKMSKKANPLAWLSGLLMVAAMWGCERDRQELMTIAGVYETAITQGSDARPTVGPHEQSYFYIAWKQEPPFIVNSTVTPGLETFTKGVQFPSQPEEAGVASSPELSSVQVAP